MPLDCLPKPVSPWNEKRTRGKIKRKENKKEEKEEGKEKKGHASLAERPGNIAHRLQVAPVAGLVLAESFPNGCGVKTNGAILG